MMMRVWAVCGVRIPANESRCDVHAVELKARTSVRKVPPKPLKFVVGSVRLSWQNDCSPLKPEHPPNSLQKLTGDQAWRRPRISMPLYPYTTSLSSSSASAHQRFTVESRCGMS
jgi:hypothetical protein